MEKVRLEIDELRLESFNTSDAPPHQRGTVNGYVNPTDEMDCTAFETCFGTCACNTADCTTHCTGFGTFIGSGG